MAARPGRRHRARRPAVGARALGRHQPKPPSSSSAWRTSPTTGARTTSCTSRTPGAARRRPAGTPVTSTNGRIWKLVLDRKDPTKAKLSILIEGDDNPVKTLGEIHQPDNVESTKDGLFVTEDPGSSQQFPFGSTDPNGARPPGCGDTASTGDARRSSPSVNQAADEGPTDRDAVTSRGEPRRLGVERHRRRLEGLRQGRLPGRRPGRNAHRRGGAARARSPTSARAAS